MFNRNLRTYVFPLFLMLLLVATSEEQCLLNYTQCSRKSRKFESGKGKMRESLLLGMKRTGNIPRYLKDTKPGIFSSNIIKNTTNRNNPIRLKTNLNFTNIRHQYSGLANKSVTDSEEGSQSSKRKRFKRYLKHFNSRNIRNSKFHDKELTYVSNRIEQRPKDKKSNTAEFYRQLQSVPNENKALRNYFPKLANKTFTKFPIVLKMRHNKRTLLKRMPRIQKLKKPSYFEKNNNGFDILCNKTPKKSCKSRNKVINNLKPSHLFQFFNKSNKLRRNVLFNISQRSFSPTNISKSNNSIDVNISPKINKNNTNDGVLEVTDVSNAKSEKFVDVTNIPMQIFYHPLLTSSTEFSDKSYRSGTEQLKKIEDATNISYPFKDRSKQYYNKIDNIKPRHLREYQRKRDSSMDNPEVYQPQVARILYASDQQDYLQSKVKINMPKTNLDQEQYHIWTTRVTPFWQNIKDYDILKAGNEQKNHYNEFYKSTTQRISFWQNINNGEIQKYQGNQEKDNKSFYKLTTQKTPFWQNMKTSKVLNPQIKQENGYKEFYRFSTQATPLWKNLQNSEVLHTKHIHHTFYNPNIQKSPNFLNATTQRDIRKLLQFLKKVIGNSKAEATEDHGKMTENHPVKTYTTKTVETENHFLDMIQNPLMDAHHTIKAIENVTDSSNYITIKYQKNAEIIIKSEKLQDPDYSWVKGILGLILVAGVCVVTVTVYLTVLKYKCEQKRVNFDKSGVNANNLGWFSAIQNILPNEEHIDEEVCDRMAEENRELKRHLKRILDEMVFSSDSYIKERYSKQKHWKKLQDVISRT